MTLKQYIVLMALGTLVASATLGVIVSSVSPTDAGAIVFTLFYASLFCAMLGVSTLVGLVVRMFMFREAHSIPQKVQMSFRQGILFGTLATASMILKGNDMLTWWNTALLVGAVSSVEMAFMGLSSRD